MVYKQRPLRISIAIVKFIQRKSQILRLIARIFDAHPCTTFLNSLSQLFNVFKNLTCTVITINWPALSKFSFHQHTGQPSFTPARLTLIPSLTTSFVPSNKDNFTAPHNLPFSLRIISNLFLLFKFRIKKLKMSIRVY